MSKIQELLKELRSRAALGDLDAIRFISQGDSTAAQPVFPDVTPINEGEFGFSLSPEDHLKVQEFNRQFGLRTQENFNRNEAANRRLIESAMRSGFV